MLSQLKGFFLTETWKRDRFLPYLYELGLGLRQDFDIGGELLCVCDRRVAKDMKKVDSESHRC